MPGPLSWTPTLKRLVAVGFHVNPEFGNDAGFLAGIQRIVDGFLDRREQRLARIIESEQVTVLGEELADGNVALLRSHGLGGNPPPRWCFVFHSSRTTLLFMTDRCGPLLKIRHGLGRSTLLIFHPSHPRL